MDQKTERDLFAAVRSGAEEAFERVYDSYHERVRLVAWKVCHRPDWLDDILNESWCRAFAQRKTFQPDRPFLIWMAGIVRNVYREHCRKSPTILDELHREGAEQREGGSDDDPQRLAAEAELLAGLNECVARLNPADADVVRLRFFGGKTLRSVAQDVAVPESTLREVRIPAILAVLKRCLAEKGIELSAVFPAHNGGSSQ